MYYKVYTRKLLQFLDHGYLRRELRYMIVKEPYDPRTESFSGGKEL